MSLRSPLQDIDDETLASAVLYLGGISTGMVALYFVSALFASVTGVDPGTTSGIVPVVP